MAAMVHETTLADSTVGTQRGALAPEVKTPHYGAIYFLLEKLGAVVATSNLHPCGHAAMRGESLEDFLATRNTKVPHSVATQK